LKSRAKIATAALVLGLTLTAEGACRRRSAATTGEYTDPNPLPAEPLVTNVETIGRYGGRFVIGETGNPKTFNAPMANESSSTDITSLIFTALIGYDNALQQFVPGLAKTWEVAPDGATWTFHLREGAAFSDGHPITAEDVLFNFEISYDEKLHPPIQELLKVRGQRFEVSAPDRSTVVVKTPTPVATLLAAVGSVPILPKHILEPSFKDGSFASAYNVSTPPDKLVTSGPWRVTQYVPGEKTVLGRNPYWFGLDQARHRLPYLNEVVFLAVPDQDAADLKFRSGELHGLDNVKPENYRWYEEHQQQGNFTLYDLGPDLNVNFFWFNLNKIQKPTAGKKIGDPVIDPVKYGWFSNPEFRHAVSMAIDQDGMIPSIFFGQGYANYSRATPGNVIWHNEDIVRYGHDPAGSKRLLAKLGWKDRDGDGVIEDAQSHPVSFTMKTNSDNTLRVAMANFVKDDLAKVGIKLTIAPVEFNTLVTNIRSDLMYDSAMLGLQTGVPPDPAMAQNVWRSSGLTHYWFINQLKPATPAEARIDELMDTIVTTQDLSQRKQAYREVEMIVNQQGWFVWLPIRRQKVPVSNRFGNIHPTVIPHRLLWNIERVFVKAPN
jgi:peptide/nickel transport system substrate-binding protein